MPSHTLAPPIHDASTCAAGGPGEVGCRACVEACPYRAISVRHQSGGSVVAIDPGQCQRCGACTGVCPTSSLDRAFDRDDDLAAAIAAAAGTRPGEVLVLTCDESPDRLGVLSGATVLRLRSLLVLNETHLIHALRSGAAGVVLVGCPDCHHFRPDLLSAPIEFVRGLTGDEGAVGYVEDDGSKEAVEHLMAYIVFRAGRDVLSQVADHPARPRRQWLRHLLDGELPAPGRVDPLGEEQFGSVVVADADCTMCGACSRACPTGALVYDAAGGSLAFEHLDCVNCGICVGACPEGAITLVPGLADRFDARHDLVVDDVVACSACGEPFQPARLAAHVRAVLDGLDRPLPPTAAQLDLCGACRTVEWVTPDRTGGQGVGVSFVNRRQFMKGAAATAAVGALLPIVGRSTPTMAIEATPVITPGRMGMVIDLERCIGCHACTNICKAENNVPLGTFRDWVEEHVLGEYPNARPVFLPKLCNHCDDPGCLRACPTGAISKRADGIVDLDSSICIACQACMQGCPYGMTFYNHQRNTADKCNLCVHRIDAGLNPACVDICPSQCRIVGDFDDPGSPVSRYLEGRASTGIREDYGLGPNIRYVGLPGELNR